MVHPMHKSHVVNTINPELHLLRDSPVKSFKIFNLLLHSPILNSNLILSPTAPADNIKYSVLQCGVCLSFVSCPQQNAIVCLGGGNVVD